MLLRQICQLRFGTYNKPTILQGLRSYKNSAAQSHLHDYIRSDEKLQQIKKQKIDYEFITKQSTGELLPTGAWTFDQIRKQLGQIQQSSKTQQQNHQILQQCESDIQKAIQQYYTNIGKKNYQFNLSEEINKINQMTDQQFKSFNNVVHNKKNIIVQGQSQNNNEINQSKNKFVRFEKKQKYDNKKYK